MTCTVRMHDMHGALASNSACVRTSAPCVTCCRGSASFPLETRHAPVHPTHASGSASISVGASELSLRQDRFKLVLRTRRCVISVRRTQVVRLQEHCAIADMNSALYMHVACSGTAPGNVGQYQGTAKRHLGLTLLQACIA